MRDICNNSKPQLIYLRAGLIHEKRNSIMGLQWKQNCLYGGSCSGCRITPVVTSVVNYLYKTGVVRTAQQLRDDISGLLGYQVNLATIYRVLERLLQCGIVCSMHRADGLMRYYLCRNPQLNEHHHFICSSCMRVRSSGMF